MHEIHSFPPGFIHAVWENTVKLLVDIWIGECKDLGDEVREISASDWEAVGIATERCRDLIPSQYAPKLPNVATNRSSFSAEMWCFWTIFIAPIVLNGLFRRPSCYRHFMDLVKLLRKCLQYTIRRSEVEELRRGFAKWVQDYERFVRLN